MIDNIDTLRAKVRLSLARMYVRDLENRVNFGNMVNGRAEPFNCSRVLWITFILKISEETRGVIPSETNIVIERLKSACPELPIEGSARALTH